MSVRPRSLYGRLLLLLLAAVLGSHALTLGWIVRERDRLARAMMVAYVGQDLAASLAILDRVPAHEREEWLPRLARANYTYELVGAVSAAPGGTPPSAASPGDSPFTLAVQQSIADAMGAHRLVSIQERDDGGMRHLALALRLHDGDMVQVHIRPPGMPVSWQTLVALAAQGVLLALAVAWAVRLATRPLRRFADAAEAFDPDRSNAPLPMHGPEEVQRAALAFNSLQQRLDRHTAERSRLLADIAHDLRTPLTRMNIRADLMADDALRDKLQADLQEMQDLVEAGIAYAHSTQPATEATSTVDLHALLDGLVCDYVDLGRAVHLISTPAAPFATRPLALRRVLGNLIDNALKFGGEAWMELERGAAEVRIRVRDRGPGIPSAQFAEVIQPFYRLENSRNRDSGGAGLGLAIAHRLSAHALHGRLVLRNHPAGGLEAELVLPDQRPRAPNAAD